jgi:hypothetical protein
VARTLQAKSCAGPRNTASKADQEAWRTQWAGAFTLKYRQVINDSKTLALALAELAKRIRSRANTVLALESDTGHLRQLHKAFKDNLIADLTHDGFADMFAQTITYGSVYRARQPQQRCAGGRRRWRGHGAQHQPVPARSAADFLQRRVAAPATSVKRVDFDELGINEVVTTLRDVPMDAVLRSFNKPPGDDPVIHFYEDFLKAYDKKPCAPSAACSTPPAPWCSSSCAAWTRF